MNLPLFFLQPDTIPDAVQEISQTPDTTLPEVQVSDSLLKPKPLPFPEERVIIQPEKEVAPTPPKVDPEAQARMKKLALQKELDSLNDMELQNLNQPFVDLDDYETVRYIKDTNFFNAKVTAEVIHEKPLIFKTFSPDWIFGILLVSSFFVILIRSYYDRYLTLVFKSFHNYQFSYKLYKDSSVVYTQLSYILNFNSAIVLGLFVFQLIKYSNSVTFLGFTGFNIFLIVPVILIGIYVLQYVVYTFIGDLTLRRNAGKEYLHHSFMLNKILGLVFIPITLCIAYFPDYMRVYLIYIALAVIVIFYFKRLQRGFTILNRNHVLKFYWILYFCTLEILPVLIMVKLIISFI
jgi:hypothetical protein